jgi:glutamine amidotransferase
MSKLINIFDKHKYFETNMIAIINYDLRQSEILASFLIEIGVPNCISINETEILNAQGIILPNCSELKNVLKQLHLKNLFSALRICKKPVLGIGNGMIMMCENTVPDNLKGMGFFNLTAHQFIYCGKKEDLLKSHNLQSRLLTLTKDVQAQTVEVDYIIEDNDYSLFSFHNSNKRLSAFIETSNYFGTIINPISSGNVGEALLKNFYDYCVNLIE